MLCCRTVLIACNVKQMSKDVQPAFSADDIAKIKKFSKTRSKVSEERGGFGLKVLCPVWPSLCYIWEKLGFYFPLKYLLLASSFVVLAS